MVELTRLNGKPLVVNSDLIKFVERAPDTVLTLITGEKVLVRETTAEIIERIIRFRCNVLAGLPVAGANLHLASSLRSKEKEDDTLDEDDSEIPGEFGG